VEQYGDLGSKYPHSLLCETLQINFLINNRSFDTRGPEYFLTWKSRVSGPLYTKVESHEHEMVKGP
jgi:hypothetical protein